MCICNYICIISYFWKPETQICKLVVWPATSNVFNMRISLQWSGQRRPGLPWPCPYWGQWCRRESFQPPPAQFGQLGPWLSRSLNFWSSESKCEIWIDSIDIKHISNLGTSCLIHHPDWPTKKKKRFLKSLDQLQTESPDPGHRAASHIHWWSL